MAYSLILFYSSNYTMWAQNVLKDGGYTCKLVSVPRELSSDCGHCIEIDTIIREKAEELLEKSMYL